VLRTVPAVQALAEENLIEFKKPDELNIQSCDEGVYAVGWETLLSFDVTLPGFLTLTELSDSSNGAKTVLYSAYGDIGDCLNDVRQLSEIFVAELDNPLGLTSTDWKNSENFPVEFKADGKIFKLAGTIQADGGRTWAHLKDKGKWVSGLGSEVVTDENVVDKDTEFLIYSHEGDFDLVGELKSELNDFLDVTDKIASREKGFLRLLDPTASVSDIESTRAALAHYKMTYGLENEFANISLMEKEARLKHLLVSLPVELRAGMWSEAAAYRDMHTDAPMTFVNLDGDCFLNSVVQVILALPDHQRYIESVVDDVVKEEMLRLSKMKSDGQAVADLLALRNALGDQLIWATGGHEQTTLQNFIDMMPALKEEAVVIQKDALGTS
jgi:hypothetical protein